MADDAPRSGWTFLTNHAHVLVCVAEEPDARGRDIATRVGITERAAQAIVADLVADGYVTRTREGRRNRYEIHPDAPLRHPLEAHHTVGELLVTLGSPLAIANVQQCLRDRAGRPHPVPPEVHAWENFADFWDPVALDKTLRDDFDPPPRFAHDHLVNNPARDNHALAGYCSIASVRAAIAGAAG